MYPLYGHYWEGYEVRGGALNLARTSPAQSWVEPITVEQAASYLKLDLPLDGDEALELPALISAVRRQAEIMQNRDLVLKQYEMTLDFWPGHFVKLRAPLVSVDLVQYRDSDGTIQTLTQDADYVVDLASQPGGILPSFAAVTWPYFVAWPASPILIRFTSGMAADDPFWSDTGALVKIGMKRLLTDWHTNRLPFERRMNASDELPYAVTACLSTGALERVF